MNNKTAMRRLRYLTLLIFANTIHMVAQTDSIYRLPPGTRVHLKVEVELSSKVASVNDTFLASVAKPVSVNETVVLPAGAVVEGRVTRVSRAASFGQDGTLGVVFENLRLAAGTRRIEGVFVGKAQRSSSSKLAVLGIAGGVAAGAGIGAATRSSNGALIGAATGTGFGTLFAFLLKGKEARLTKDAEFEIELKREVVLPVTDY